MYRVFFYIYYNTLMLNFVFILTIFLEIILTSIIVLKIIELEKKIVVYNEELNILGESIIKISKNIKTVIVNLNKFVKILTNKKLIQTLRLVKMLMDTVQIIILLRSLNLSMGLKSINFKNIKKVMMTEVARRFIRRLILSASFSK